MAGSSLPPDIFIYLNSGTDELGEYQGVCSLEEFQTFQTFNWAPILKFGNKYVKFSKAKITVDSEEEVSQAIAFISDSVKSLNVAFTSTQNQTLVINIP